MRNLGGAVGIAVVNTWLQDNTRIQAQRFSEMLGQGAGIAHDTVAALSQQLEAVTPDPAHALLLAEGVLNRIVSQQALTIAFDDVFRLMCWIFVAALLMVPFARPSAGSGTQKVAAAEAH